MVLPSSHLLMHQTGAATIAAQEQAAGCVDVKPMASLPKANQRFSSTICMVIIVETYVFTHRYV